MVKGKKIKLSEEELLDEIRRVSQLESVPDDPRAKDMNKHGCVSAGAITNKFESWTKAKKLANIDNVRQDPNYQQLTCAACNSTETVPKSAYINMYNDWLCSSKCKKKYYKQKTNCDNCGEEIQRARSQIDRFDSVYCNDSCKREDESEDKNHRHNLSNWSKIVKQNANYTCKDCGESYDVMCAHHNPPRKELSSKEEELNTENGVCLCYPCHAERHKNSHEKDIILAWWEWYQTN